MLITELTTSFLIAFGLAMDAFAVSIGVTTNGQVHIIRSKLRLAWHFGVFQLGMTVIGWLAGGTIAAWIDGFDHWIALGLLCYVGINMIRSGLSGNPEKFRMDPSKGWSLIILSIATSLDALAVGLSFAMLGENILIPALLIGLVAFGLSCVGVFTGHKLGEKMGQRMEVFGGIVLIFIGLRILITHL